MYPYQLLVAVVKKRKTVLVGKREIIVAIITEFLIKYLSIHVIRGFHVQSTQIAVYLHCSTDLHVYKQRPLLPTV